MIIGIVGPKKVGKETVAKYLMQHYRFKAHSHSEVLREILSILNQPLTRMNYIKLVSLRKTFGEDVLVNAVNKKLKAGLELGPVVVTGVRFRNEFDNVKYFPDSAVIYIDAPPELRYEWQKNAAPDKADDAVMSYEEFQSIEMKETESGIAELGVMADYKIENTGTKEELFKKVDQIIMDMKIDDIRKRSEQA